MRLYELQEEILADILNTDFAKNFGVDSLKRGNSHVYTAKHNFRFSRMPTDTWIPIHQEINRLSKKKYGIEIRSLLIASTEISQATEYGELVYIVPCNGFRIFHHPSVFDMTDDLKVYNYRLATLIMETVGVLNSDKRKDTTLSLGELNEKITHTKSDSIDDAFKQIIEYIAANIYIDLPSALRSLHDMYDKNFKTEIHDYVNGIKEITNENELLSHDGEVMIYSPNGFYTVDPYDIE